MQRPLCHWPIDGVKAKPIPPPPPPLPKIDLNEWIPLSVALDTESNQKGAKSGAPRCAYLVAHVPTLKKLIFRHDTLRKLMQGKTALDFTVPKPNSVLKTPLRVPPSPVQISPPVVGPAQVILTVPSKNQPKLEAIFRPLHGLQPPGGTVFNRPQKSPVGRVQKPKLPLLPIGRFVVSNVPPKVIPQVDTASPNAFSVESLMQDQAMETLLDVIVDSSPTHHDITVLTADKQRYHTTHPRHLTCTTCARQYKSQRQMYLHNKRVHDRVSRSCVICGKPVKGQVAMLEHRRVHLGEADLPFECSLCGSRFKERCHMNAHRRYKHHEVVSKDKKSKVEV